MKKFLQSKAKILMVCFFVLLTCTACSNPRGKDGKTKVDQIIAIEETQVERSKVSIEGSEKEYKNLKDDDLITIEKTEFTDAWKNGWFEGIIVWPIAQLLNLVATYTDAGIGIIVTTVLIQLLLFAFTHKSQMSSQRMQEIQPEIARIQNKYADKTDEASKMKMYQETQDLYTKYDIHPFGTMLITFLQFPVMIGMYYATMRAITVVNGTFLGMDLSGTVMQGITKMQFGYIIIYVLMIVCQFVSMKLPQWLKKYEDKQNHVKVKKYAEPEQKASDPTQMTMYMSIVMIAVLYISWPIAMSFYWMVSSLYRICQTFVLHVIMKKK
ncbi:YidC/Oxa1 family membrane protein insertase [Floccifex sp.]|uniref:YidC/Oxa1 family membrane protein insertase n=1 Tax=Floccifex sp. TaxID=2815810 RepID=UPI003F0592D5